MLNSGNIANEEKTQMSRTDFSQAVLIHQKFEKRIRKSSIKKINKKRNILTKDFPS